MRTAGVIGGLGPATTSHFYLQLIFSCFKSNPHSRPPVLIWSVPLSYSVEDELRVRGVAEARFSPYLQDAARRLERGGADFIVIPCNTAHIWIDDVKSAVSIPVLSIIEETSQLLISNKVGDVALLGTKPTIDQQLYQSILAAHNITTTVPPAADQQTLELIISNIVANRHRRRDHTLLRTILDRLASEGATNVLLACTDLQMLSPKHPRVRIFDSLTILADATVREIIKTC